MATTPYVLLWILDFMRLSYVIHFQQKSATFRYVVDVSFSELVYLYHNVMQLFPSEPLLLFFAECEVPEDPLAVGGQCAELF